MNEIITPIKKKPTSTAHVADFLTKTGFILEMEVSEWLKKRGYSIKVNNFFVDYDLNKKREIDIIATKKLNGIDIILIIECKQSLVDDWIFICSDTEPSRYYSFQKHFPEVEKIKESKIFDHLHLFDHKIPLAQNFIIRSVENKKSTSNQIDSCIEKLPKIVVDTANSVDKRTVRTLFVPLTVFSGKIFTASYRKKLLVKDVDIVQYYTKLESDGYIYNFSYNRLTQSYTFPSLHNQKGDWNKIEGKKLNSPVAETSRELGSYYLLDFVTKKGLNSFIKRLESEIKNIDTKLWPVETPTKNTVK